MKNQNNKNKTFSIYCEIDNREKLAINIPLKIYPSFESCGSCQEGMSLLCTIFHEFEQMPINMRHEFQQFIYYACDDIEDMRDILYIIRAVKKSAKK